MAPDHVPEIVIATQSVEGNVPALRLLQVCAEFGRVTIITPQKGTEAAGGVTFRRLIPNEERFWRGLRFFVRKAGALLPAKFRRKWVEGFAVEWLGIKHQSARFKHIWRKWRLCPALLVLDGAEYSMSALKLARKARSGLLYYVHEMFPNEKEHYAAALTACYCRIERQLCGVAAHIIVQHHLWGKLLRRRYGLPASKFTEVTPSPAPQEQHPGSGADEPLRLYYHGIYTGNRGLDVIIKAVILVPGVNLDLRGFGPYESEMRRMVAGTGAEDRVHFLPPLPTEQLAASARGYDLGVVTGASGHLNGRMAAGMKLYEYIAAGIGLFAFHAITVRNTVRLHGIGFVYDGTSAELVAASLRRCLARRAEISLMRRRAAEAARSYFNSERQYERLRAVIARALIR